MKLLDISTRHGSFYRVEGTWRRGYTVRFWCRAYGDWIGWWNPRFRRRRDAVRFAAKQARKGFS